MSVWRRLAPWLSPLLEMPLQLSLARDGCVDSLVTVAVQVDLTDVAARIGDARPEPHPLDPPVLRTLREAIDLLYLVLVLDPALLWTGEKRYGYLLAQRDAIAAQALARCGYFVETLDQQASTDSKFLSVREELEKKFVSANRPWQRQLEQPVALRLSIAPTVPANAEPYLLEDQLRHIVEIIEYADAMKPSLRGQHEDHFPVAVERVVYEVDQSLITYRALQLIKRLQHVRKNFAVCERVSLDARLIQCSSDEITAFLDAVDVGCDGHKGLKVETSVRTSLPIDGGGIDRSDLCETIIRCVASCDHASVVDMDCLIYTKHPGVASIVR